jgi:hypothetical protein
MLLEAVSRSRSIRETLKKLGLAPAGGNYACVKKAIANFGIDISHFTGQAHLRGKTHDYKKRPLGQILKRGKVENTHRLKRRLIAEGLKPRRCQSCGLADWLGQAIPLELHHQDGDRINNVLSNLMLLCPNCHALTDNYRGKNKKV